jgi:hypothetical protein
LVGDDHLGARVSEPHLEGVWAEERRHRYRDAAQFVDGEVGDYGGGQLRQDNGNAVAQGDAV